MWWSLTYGQNPELPDAPIPPLSRVHESSDLPLPEPKFTGKIGRSYKESEPAYPVPIRPPEGAPNIVLIVLDDVGFGQCGTFGGAIPTPHLDRLAREGLRFTRFHTAGLCSPTRAALLTGRNHHSCGAGVITELSMGYPGYNSILGQSCATIAEILKGHGYGTAAFGKWHNTPEWELGPAGPFDRWPTGLGFERFYGFMGPNTNQWRPALYEGTRPVESPLNKPDYHLTTDLVDRAVAWVEEQQGLAPGRPYFLYFAPGATHAPHHAPREWIERFRGKFDRGWDVYRQETFQRQQQLGLVPENTTLTPRPAELPAWESLSPDERRVAARLMEVYAGFTAHMDYELGRLLAGLEVTGSLDNTLLMCLVGDNGASAEGGLGGLSNEISLFNFKPDPLEWNLSQIDKFGGSEAASHIPAGWAWAMNTPFQWTKQVASHLGGIRNPLLVRWPKTIRDPGAARTQFLHVIDVVPTLLEASHLREPEHINGVTQKPIEGTSFFEILKNVDAPEIRATQYFEIVGNRGIYHEGWFASCRRNIPWELHREHADLETLPWELYRLDEDFSQAHDVSADNASQLKHMQELFWVEAARHQVLPIEDRGIQRLFGNSRPGFLEDIDQITLTSSIVRVPEGSAPNLKNHGYHLTVDVEIPTTDTSGMLITQGGRFGGWGLYLHQGYLVYCYNFLNRERYVVRSPQMVPTGRCTLECDFKYKSFIMGGRGDVTLTINQQPAGEGQITHTQGVRVTNNETLDVGRDTGTPLNRDYEVPFNFPGKIHRVTVKLP